MLDILESILDFFVTIINFVVTLVTGLLQFFQMLPGIQNFMLESVSFLPNFVAPFFVLGVSALIVKVILDLL